MEPQKLNDKEKAFISDNGDMIHLEIIKGMSLEELKKFDIYCPIDLKHYNGIQVSWLKTEKYLMGHRDGALKEVSEEELIEDIEKFHNGERFRVFYVLKYPHLVKRINTKEKTNG